MIRVHNFLMVSFLTTIEINAYPMLKTIMALVGFIFIILDFPLSCAGAICGSTNRYAQRLVDFFNDCPPIAEVSQI
jgi:hypothetical protein